MANRPFLSLILLLLLAAPRFFNPIILPAHAQTIVTTIAVGANPQGVAVNAVTDRIYVASEGSNDVSVIDGNSRSSPRSALGMGRRVSRWIQPQAGSM